MPTPKGFNWREHIQYQNSQRRGIQFQAQRNSWGQHIRRVEAVGVERERATAQRLAAERQHDAAQQRAAIEREAVREDTMRAQAHSSIVAQRTNDLVRKTENSLAKGTRLLSHHGTTGTYGRGLTESDLLTEADRREDNESMQQILALGSIKSGNGMDDDLMGDSPMEGTLLDSLTGGTGNHGNVDSFINSVLEEGRIDGIREDAVGDDRKRDRHAGYSLFDDLMSGVGQGDTSMGDTSMGDTSMGDTSRGDISMGNDGGQGVFQSSIRNDRAKRNIMESARVAEELREAEESGTMSYSSEVDGMGSNHRSSRIIRHPGVDNFSDVGDLVSRGKTSHVRPHSDVDNLVSEAKFSRVGPRPGSETDEFIQADLKEHERARNNVKEAERAARNTQLQAERDVRKSEAKKQRMEQLAKDREVAELQKYREVEARRANVNIKNLAYEADLRKVEVASKERRGVASKERRGVASKQRREVEVQALAKQLEHKARIQEPSVHVKPKPSDKGKSRIDSDNYMNFSEESDDQSEISEGYEQCECTRCGFWRTLRRGMRIPDDDDTFLCEEVGEKCNVQRHGDKRSAKPTRNFDQTIPGRNETRAKKRRE
jgi:hypothetical protein